MQNEHKDLGHMVEGPKTMDGMLELIDQLIEERGHIVQLIQGDEDHLPFGYTVGLHDAGWPEIVIIGTHPESSQAILNAIVTDLRKREVRPADGMMISGIAEFPLRLQAPKGPTDAWIMVAKMRAKQSAAKSEVEVLQLLWPDDNGKFPGQEGCLLPESHQFQI